MNSVDIVIPVYDGFEEVRRCLASVLDTVDTHWARVVVVNDASPNPQITDYLRDLAGQRDAMVLLENPQNLGFVATANRGMREGPERDVLLLNSDVEVSNDWLARLRDTAYAKPSVASVTPFSNNATICSFPNICEDNRLLFGLGVAELDRAFADRFGAGEVTEIPTGVGFCMYIRRDCLQAVGYFDEDTFGRGYGEENDWCQRAERAGWKNYLASNCFVFHKGRVSFGDEHNPRVENALRLLDERYPRYHTTVADYIARDPVKLQRVEVILQLLAAQDKPKLVAISHKLGGGAQQHVDELVSLYEGQALFLQLTPDRDGSSVILSIYDDGRKLKDGLYFDIEQEYDKLVELLRSLGIGRVHFHHTMGLHPRVWLLAQDLGCGYDLTIHDYYLINGNPTLTDKNARFVADGDTDFDERCAGHYPLPEGLQGEGWRDNQRLLVEGADRVIFPSEDAAQRFCRFFDVAQRVVAWHPDYQSSQPYPSPEWKRRSTGPLKVVVLGAISREKGADVLEAVAHQLADEPVEFHLLGYAYRALSEQVVTHGPYENSEVYAHISAVDPDVVWFPALWPETYSYTLSIALHLGLPVGVPDIGAFRERVAERPLSVIRPWDSTTQDWTAFWRGVVDAGMTGVAEHASAAPVPSHQDGAFYRGSYVGVTTPRKGSFGADTSPDLAANLTSGRPELSRSERFLGRIWRLSRRPLAARLISVVPFRLQRAIKRRFSSRPMHDIVGGR
jgi:GT2 family glycosyltransferase/glycosyltransferase involved in cell wall biosynthesis